MADYKLPVITGTSLTTGDLLRWDGSNWINYADSIYQAQGDILDDLNTLGANSADGEFLVGTEAGVLAWESGATARTSLQDILAIKLPSTRLNDWDSTGLVTYLKDIHYKNQNIKFKCGTYAHGITAVNDAYYGGVYSPTQNRIYLVPREQADESNWHYIDCSDGSVHAYAHGVTAVDVAYVGGVYSPTQNRIYLVPRGQSDESNWHYIQEFSTAEISPSIAANALFNKL